MSLITQVVVIAPIIRDEQVPGITDPLPFDERQQSLRRLNTEQAGGVKVFSQSIYAAAFNYLDVGAFEDWLDALPWGYARPLVLIREEMEDWRTYEVKRR
jgi:hypothetical protein